MKPNERQLTFPEDRSYFFEISTLESLNINKGSIHNPLRRPHSQLIWITRGAGYFTIDQEKFQITDNTIYTLPPGRCHQFRPTDVITGWILSFNLDFLNLAIEGPGRPFFKEICADLNRVKMVVLPSDNPVLENLLGDIAREFETNLMLRLEMLSGLFKIFLMYMKRLAVSAKRLAMYGDGSMKIVANTLGFDDLSHFSKFFKNAAGVNFSAYKKNNFFRFRQSSKRIGE
jgi:hypothetical protein